MAPTCGHQRQRTVHSRLSRPQGLRSTTTARPRSARAAETSCAPQATEGAMLVTKTTYGHQLGQHAHPSTGPLCTPTPSTSSSCNHKGPLSGCVTRHSLTPQRLDDGPRCAGGAHTRVQSGFKRIRARIIGARMRGERNHSSLLVDEGSMHVSQLRKPKQLSQAVRLVP